MDDKQKKLNAISEAMQKQIYFLLSKKITGKIELTVEINVTQGFVGSANLSLRKDSMEKIF